MNSDFVRLLRYKKLNFIIFTIQINYGFLNYTFYDDNKIFEIYITSKCLKKLSHSYFIIYELKYFNYFLTFYSTAIIFIGSSFI